MRYGFILRATAYTFALFLIQAQWISRLPHHSLRVDLLLPVVFGVALEWPPFLSLFWACLWGLAADSLSGKFWGFHVASYVFAVCFVNVAAEKLEFQNPIYQMSFIGSCALGQSLVLGLFLLFEPAGLMTVSAAWKSLVLRAVLMTLISPLILYPLANPRRGPV